LKKTIANLDHCRSNLRFGVAESCWFLPVQRFFPLFEAKALGNEFLTGQLDDYSTID